MKTQNVTRTFCAIFSSALLLMSSGCATRVVYVPSGEPMRLAQPVKARVWVRDADGKTVRSANRVTISEGWYVLPRE